MKLFLLTCLVAFASALPSHRAQRDILPGDARYNAEHQHQQGAHAQHQNEFETARALSSSPGCFLPQASVKAAKEPTPITDGSLAEVKGEPVSSIKSDVAVDTSADSANEVSQAEPTVAVAKPATFAAKEAEYASPVETRVNAEDASTSDVAQNPESAIADDKGASYEKEAEYETKSEVAAPQNVATAEESAQSPLVNSQPEHEAKFESRTGIPANYAVKSGVAFPQNIAPAEESPQAPLASVQPEPQAKWETGSDFPANYAVKSGVASPQNVAPAQESAQAPLASVQPEQQAKWETGSDFPANYAVKSGVAPPQNVAPAQESAQAPLASVQPEQQAKWETGSGFPANYAVKSGVASPQNIAPAQESAQAPIVSPQPEQEAKFETRSHIPANYAVKSGVASPQNVAPAQESAQAPLVNAQPEHEAKFETRSGGQPESYKQTPKESAEPSPAKVQPAIEAKSSVATPSSKLVKSASPTGSSTTPSKSKFGSPAGSSFNPGFRSPVHPAFPPSPFNASPFYNPGYNAFDQARYNPNVDPGFGYNPGFGAYGRPGGYYPGHPFGFGPQSAFDQDLKGKAAIAPHAPVGYPHPFTHPQSYQFHGGYPHAHPVSQFKSVQQTEQ